MSDETTLHTPVREYLREPKWYITSEASITFMYCVMIVSSYDVLMYCGMECAWRHQQNVNITVETLLRFVKIVPLNVLSWSITS